MQIQFSGDAWSEYLYWQTQDKRTLKRITVEQEARLNAIAAMPDTQIDYSDAQNLPNAVWLPVKNSIG